MTVRRRLQRRVYVEDELPAFLKAGHAPASQPVRESLPPPPAVPGAVQGVGRPAPSLSAPSQSPSPSRALVPVAVAPAADVNTRMDAAFMLRLAAVTITINIALSVLLTPPVVSPRLATAPAQAVAVATPIATRVEDRVITFSLMPDEADAALPSAADAAPFEPRIIVPDPLPITPAFATRP